LTDKENINLVRTLTDAADAVQLLRKECGTVFIHCVTCQTRTPSVAVAWLIRYEGLGMNDALRCVRRAIPTMRLNPSMKAALENVQPSPKSTLVTDNSDAGVSAALNALSPGAWRELEGFYTEYGSAFALRDLLRRLGLDVAINWMTWPGFIFNPRNPFPATTLKAITNGSAEDALRFAVCLSRSDGHACAAADHTGVTRALLGRLAQWRTSSDGL
jgi:hypothetical protein